MLPHRLALGSGTDVKSLATFSSGPDLSESPSAVRLPIDDLTALGEHIPVLDCRIRDIVCPGGKLLVGIDDASSLCRPLPASWDDDAVWVLSLFGNADGIIVTVIDAPLVLLHLGTKDERTFLEVETVRLWQGDLLIGLSDGLLAGSPLVVEDLVYQTPAVV